LLLATGASACAAQEPKDGEKRRSHPGRLLQPLGEHAGHRRPAHRELGADLFEILPATPYPDDYEQTVEQARQERDVGARPPLKATVPNIAAYDTVFLAFPIWGETAPPIIRGFLAAHDLSGKTVRPVITHGGYGLGDSLAVLKSHAPSRGWRRPSRWRPTRNAAP
jgi:hypothetical protein